MSKFIKFFDEIGIKDVPDVGGKNASLGEMYSKLKAEGISVPNGFATTSEAYDYFLDKSNLKEKIKQILEGLDTHDVSQLMRKGAQVRKAILDAKLPQDFQDEISFAYQKLSKFYKTKNVDVAIRSSATAEDLPDASFAGQQDTYLNITKESEIILHVKKCISSLFTNRAISYREDKGFDHFEIALSVGVQKMVRSDLGSSGVMFTIDTESGFRNAVFITSIYGLGENIVQGKVNPDEFYVFKKTGAIISKKIGTKSLKMIYGKNPNKPVRDVSVHAEDQMRQSISDAQIKQLAKWGMIIEAHYKRPMDIEWALDGRDKKLYIVQARPETIHSMDEGRVLKEYKLKQKGKIIVEGQSVGNKIGAGIANKIMRVKDINKFRKGQVLVTTMTDPDWEPIMKIASAIVTNQGGRTCHASIVSRELGIPCIVGANNATIKIQNNQKITVDCSQGEAGYVYDGLQEFVIKETNLEKLVRPKTKIMMNVGAPDIAFASSLIPNDGVGLARLEFIINNYIKIHPLALINYKNEDKKLKQKIDKLTFGYKDKAQFFVDKLSQGVATIAAAFYPQDVIVRLSDFKSNEYANLIGGALYEPSESNPMLGWRGANRYYSPDFLPAFELECKALKKVRFEMGLKNIKVMLPFIRTIEEAKKVIKILEKNGLKRGCNDFELYCMVEIPANAILAEKFAELFDGFSIGSNDLTQLTLGIDRDSGATLHVSGESSAKNEAVKELIKHVIQVAKKTKTKVGICGQAPSDFPDFAEFLVECGIDSISLVPDTVMKTTLDIVKKEQLINKRKK